MNQLATKCSQPQDSQPARQIEHEFNCLEDVKKKLANLISKLSNKTQSIRMSSPPLESKCQGDEARCELAQKIRNTYIFLDAINQDLESLIEEIEL